MEGLRLEIDPGLEFPGVLAPTIHQLTSNFWLIDVHSGPFRTTDKPNFFELEAEIERYRVTVAQLEDTSSALWRPEIFPRFESLFWLDEWTYLIALKGPEMSVIRTAGRFFEARILSARFFDLVESEAAAFFLYVGGSWEVYSTDQHLLDELRKQKRVSAIQSGKWLSEKFGQTSP